MTDKPTVPTVESGVVVPGLQAVVTGLLCGLLACILAGLFHWGSPWSWGGVVGAVAVLLAWLVFRAEVVERQPGTHRESNNDVIFTPRRRVYAGESALKLSIDWDSGRSGLFDDLQVSDEMFIAWGCAVASGRSLAEANWTGAAGIFTRSAYHAFLGRMIYHGMVRSRSKAHNQGYMLSAKGEAVTDEILRRYGGTPPPSPVVCLPTIKTR